MLIDSHCHLFHTFDGGNIREALSELSEKLLFLVDISTNISEILKTKEVEYPRNIFKAFGLYPDQAELFNGEMKKIFMELITAEKPAAIGEAGLDYHWNYGGPEIQERLFRNQIETAMEKELPLIVHSRDSFKDTYRILSDYRLNIPVILHCFGYGPEEAEKFMAMGFFISFAGNVTYKNAKDLQEAAKITPPDRLLVETDSPYLTPVPHRGEKNTPLHVEHTYRYLAGLKGIEIQDLTAAVEKNFRWIFRV